MSRFELVICEPDTGIVLNSDGTWHLKGHGHPEPVMRFESLDDALKKKDELMARLPGIEVAISDTTGETHGRVFVSQQTSVVRRPRRS